MPPKTSKKNIELSSSQDKKYVKMDPIDHMLARPDMYTGSTRSKNVEEFVSSFSNDNNFLFTKKSINYSPAILRIFIEPLSNSIDNCARSKKAKIPCTSIKIYVDKSTGETTIWNDGEWIPINDDNDENMYNHTLIFGHLLTSSNYNDEEERYDISGRNGIGGKVCNVFSKFFRVRGLDPKNKKTIEQIWRNNMKETSDPDIKDAKNVTKNKGYTEVTWIPDFTRFGIAGYTNDIIDLYCRYAVDCAMLTGVDVYFNDSKIPVKNLRDYSKLYINKKEKKEDEEDENNDILYIKSSDAEIVLIPGTYQSVSFVNGVYTSEGGTHVDAWSEVLFRPIVQKLTSPKGPVYNIGDVRKYFSLFISIKTDKPEFESQSKCKLESPVIADVKSKDINKILKWDVIDDIRRSKELIVLKKLERKKRVFEKVIGLDPANNEGSPDCTLILVEGLSAKTYAVNGINVGAFNKKGRDWFGIYALRGKLLNTRNAKITTIANNHVVSDVIKALGLKLDQDYTKNDAFNTLRYSRIMIITDADCDGIHISCLIQNMIHSLFSSLLKREEPFIVSMQTPIVKVYLSKTKELLFYNERAYKKYVSKFNNENPGKNIDKKYYKGLGTSDDKDILNTFGKKLIKFQNDENTTYNMNKVFNKKQADDRKIWMENFDPDNIVLLWNGEQEEVLSVSYSDYLNTEMPKFSIDDCSRSLPNLIDGQKTASRKTLYACKLKKLKYNGKTLKVAQLAGFVAEKTAYHHGEQNLCQTITNMAHEFPGSNNVPLLYGDGQFGSRLSGGKDAASARYIWTSMNALTHLLFRSEDDILLDKYVDDGEMVEPLFYVPILPVILMNGSKGIGTGWSCDIPCYDPLDLISCVEIWLNNNGKALIKDESNEEIISLFPEIKPWYRGHTGVIESSSNNRYISYGHITEKGKTKIVDELPVEMWTDDFKDYAEELLEQKKISNLKNYSTPKKVHFEFTETKEMTCDLKTLKLSKFISASNMVMFNEKGVIKKFKTVDEIIDSFCRVRYDYYIKRKKYMIKCLEHKIKFLGNKKRFLEEIMYGKIELFIEDEGKRKSRKTSDIFNELVVRGYDKEEENEEENNEKDEEEKDEKDEKEMEKGYDYLLKMPFKSITEEKINSLKNDINSKIKERDVLKSLSEKQLWLNDLTEFKESYLIWKINIEKASVKTENKIKKAPVKRK